MRASSALSPAAPGHALKERDIRTTCTTCGVQQRLDRATVVMDDPLETIYVCKHGCGPILIISTPGVVPWEGRGYRVGDWVIRNPSDLFMQTEAMAAPLLMPASPHALD